MIQYPDPRSEPACPERSRRIEGPVEGRRLLYVPIIHTSADLGSVASQVEERARAMSGEETWNEHKRTVAHFWEAIGRYFDALDVSGYQIYQDGLAADGALGMRIVEEAASRGSLNYQLVKRLVERGARIVKTEDASIVLKEVQGIKEIANARTLAGKSWAVLKYERMKGKLLEERDRYIAHTINSTLEQDGILFIGAFHSIIPRLDKDIVVEKVKAREKVAEYQKSFFLRQKQARTKELAAYLAAAIE
ncbi:MAG: hypothetical protein L6435_15300 [Anaerolineae bacterium]|nr:hypothetical protein [Anaerolineae bacterium]